MSLLIFGQHSIVFYLLMKSWFLLSILPNTFLITRTLRYTHQKTKHKLHIQGFRSDPGGGEFLFCRGYIHTLHSVPLGVIQLLINLWFEVTFFDMMGLGEIILKNLKSEINLPFWITLKFLFFHRLNLWEENLNIFFSALSFPSKPYSGGTGWEPANCNRYGVS